MTVALFLFRHIRRNAAENLNNHEYHSNHSIQACNSDSTLKTYSHVIDLLRSQVFGELTHVTFVTACAAPELGCLFGTENGLGNTPMMRGPFGVCVS